MPVVNGIIDAFDPNEEIEHIGNLRINCAVPVATKIHVKNGGLIIHGNVGPESIIRLSCTASSTSFANNIVNFFNKTCGCMLFSACGSSYPLQHYTLIINGHVEESVTIDADCSINCIDIGDTCIVRAKGNITCANVGTGSELTTFNANIHADDINEGAKLSTVNGSIRVGNVTRDVKLENVDGPITAGHVDENCVLKTSNAPITVDSAAHNVTLSTNGNVYIGTNSHLAVQCNV